MIYFRGLEKQCRDVAKTTGSEWREFWPFLQDYENLASDEGLARLENYLAHRYEEVRVFLSIFYNFT